MKKVIKNRIDTIQQSHSAVHYVKTEIGIFPCDWKIAKLSDIAEKVTQTAGTDFYETVSISAGIGFVNQAKKFGKELSGKQYEKYNVLHKGDFSYNKGNSNKYPQGCIYRLKDRETAAVPNVFESFRIRSECADFYDHLFVSGFLNQQLSKKINHGVRDDGLLNLTEKDFYRCLLPVPPLAEQKKISEILDHCDKLIKRCEAKVDEYKSLKKTCLSKMFPKNGSNAPEFRFPGFKDAWEQRKLGECFDERTERSADGELIAVTINSGVVKASELNRHDNSSEDKSNYKVVRVNDIAYNSMRMWQGASGYSQYDGILSPAYTVVIPRENVNPVFFSYMFKRTDMIHEFQINSQGLTSDTWNLKFPAFSTISANVPKSEEQRAIGKYFTNLDHLITLHQRESEEYTKLKKAMSQLLLTGIVRVNT